MRKAQGKRGLLRLAALLLAGAGALVSVPSLLVDASPAAPADANDNGWTSRSPKAPAAKLPEPAGNPQPVLPTHDDDGWNARERKIIPASGETPSTRPDRLPDSLSPPAPGKFDAPPKQVKDDGPALPLPKEALPAPKELKGTDPVLPLPQPVKPVPQPVKPVPKKAKEAKDPGERDPSPPGRDLPDRALLLAAARNAVRARDWDLAIGRFEVVLRRFGDDPEIRVEYAGVLTQAGRLKEALLSYAFAVAVKSDDPKLRVQYGDLAVYARDYPLAIIQFHRALELAPDDLEYAVRLARAYVFDDNSAAGQSTYDRLLKDVRPGDEDVPNLLPTLLVELARPQEALAFITPMLKAKPDDAELLAAQVRAFGRLDDRAKALESLSALDARAPKALTVRRELAEALYGSGDYELACLVYEQILRIEPGEQKAMIGMARVKTEIAQPLAAHAILDGFRPLPINERIFRIACAELHQLVGEWGEAREGYRALLEKDPSDHEVRFALGNLYDRAREDEKAKAEFAKIPPGSGLARRARLSIAAVLTVQRRFAEAMELCKCMIAENPTNAAPVARMVRTQARADLPDQALSLARGYLANNPRNENGKTAMLLALGRALSEAHKPQEASRVFDEVLQRPGGHTPEAFYGLAHALELLGDRERARAITATGLKAPGGEIRNRLQFAELYATDYDDASAHELLSGTAKIDPENVAVMVALAEVEGRMARLSGNNQSVLHLTQEILSRSPSNARARLTLARALSIGRDWKGSAAEYERLIDLDPDFFVPQRERARVLYSGNEFAAGASAYQRILIPPAEERLRSDLAGLAQKDVRLGLVLNPCLAAAAPARVVKIEVAKVVASLNDPVLSGELGRLLLDYEARYVEQTLAKLESEEKDKAWKPYAVFPPAKALIDLEPTNTSALFDLGQAHSTLHQTHGAMAAYSQDLRVDPREREADIALHRAGLELQPSLRLVEDVFAQRGRDGLANMVRLAHTMAARLPWGDQDEFCEFGLQHLTYRPSGDRSLEGNALLIRAQGKPDERLLTFAAVSFQTYTDRVGDRPTFEAGAWYDCTDACRIRGSLFLDNVIENGETLRQDIYRYGMRLGADYQATRRWRMSGTYTLGHYSDENDYHDLLLLSEHTIMFAPTQLKAVVMADVYGYREQTILAQNGALDLRGTVHPYFSPNLFGYVEARIEWTHWLSRDYFADSNQTWYSLQCGIGMDDQVNRYHTMRAVFHYDVKPWLSLEAEARVTLSNNYDNASAMAYVIFRLPDVK
jgi:tetratricopeptide (TPR) repeat protein